MMAEEDKFYWLALKAVPGIGNVTYRRLIDHFHSPEMVFRASIQDLMEVEGVGKSLAYEIKRFKGEQKILEEIKLMAKEGVSLLTIKDESYPDNLMQIYDPPPLLYIKGKMKKEDRDAIAIVGSRNASSYGTEIAKKISQELARQGICIVSGMARGIDSTAHRGALSVAGRTVAVMGRGLDIIYPYENKNLFYEIASHGAVVSEFPMSTPPAGVNFPRRNRIISGLSLGTLIVEASVKSGSLITANFALEQGREVFAVPGNVLSFRSKGTHRLIKQGAKLVEDAKDILEEIMFKLQLRSLKPQEQKLCESLDMEEEEILKIVGKEPIHVDEIIDLLG